jgi:toxin ParE1/3/4
MEYRFHPAALEEYREAAMWYARRQRTLASRFTASIEDALKRVVESPDRWRILEEDVRRCLTRIFPYAILYTIEGDFILILAVMHCSREPGYWHNRLANP